MFLLRTSTAAPVIKLCVLMKTNKCEKALSSKNCFKEMCIKNLVAPEAHYYTFSSFTSIHLVNVSSGQLVMLARRNFFRGMSSEYPQTTTEVNVFQMKR